MEMYVMWVEAFIEQDSSSKEDFFRNKIK